MNNKEKFEFVEKIKINFINNSFIKLTLSGYRGKIENLKNIYIKPIEIKNEKILNFVYRYKTKDITKNYNLSESIEILQEFIAKDFKIANLFTLDADYLLEILQNDKLRFKTYEPSIKILPNFSHDKLKNRKLKSNSHKKYLTLLGISDENGKVYAKAQDKFKQINHYIEILSPIIKNFDKKGNLKIVDMGSGKAYLTFALYDYLVNELSLSCNITGVEFREELVKLSNEIAKKSGFDNISFEQGSIEDFNLENIDIIIALHACDTASDDAIAKGIEANAKFIVLTPCCQHQIRQQMEKNESENILSSILKHGIFLERQAEILTDGIRNLILQYFGYTTKTIEFIADAHTHKNIIPHYS